MNLRPFDLAAGDTSRLASFSCSTGQVYDLTVNHLGTVDRDGDHIAGLVHNANVRSQRLLTSVGWRAVSITGEHDLWVGSI